MAVRATSSGLASAGGSTSTRPRLSNCQATLPLSARLPPAREKAMRMSETVRLRLSLRVSTRMATPPGP